MVLRQSASAAEERGTRTAGLDPLRPYAFLVEPECSADGSAVDVATVFLINRECPWRCVMCDLWKNSLTESVPAGAIPAQIRYALERLPAARQIKLYNSGSFFDGRAIPPSDYPAIAACVGAFENVIVECHPALIGRSALEFRDLLSGRLEVAIGLETAHPEVLARLNKGMTLEQCAAAAGFLGRHKISWRAFILIQPPFLEPEKSLEWAQRSLAWAFDHGAGAATLIPTRAATEQMKRLEQGGHFTAPWLSVAQAAFEAGLRSKRGRVFLDLWDMERNMKARECRECFDRRLARLAQMNLSQLVEPTVACSSCGGE